MRLRKRLFVVALFLFCVLLLPDIAAARMEYSLGDNRRLLVEGTLWTQTLLRSDDFKFSRQFDPVSQRNNGEVEFTVENLISNLGFIDRVDLHVLTRGIYEAIYDMRNNEFGDEGPAFGLRYGHGFKGPGFPGFQYLPDGTPVHPPGELRTNVSRRPNGKHPIFNFFPGAPWAHGRTKLRGAQNGFTNFENTEQNLKFDHTDSNDENELREFYFDITAGRHWLRLGRQQVVWGKTDFFRSQDIINPLDLGWHSFYESWEDIRIPQWIAQYQYQFGSLGAFDNVALELVMNFDDFQPIALGQAGSPWAQPFADNVNWFSLFGAAASGFFPDPNNPSQIEYFPLAIVRESHPSWSLRNMEYGGRFSWRYKGWYFALTDWYGFDDNPFLASGRLYTPEYPNGLLYWGTLQALMQQGMSYAAADPMARLFGGWANQLSLEYLRNNTIGLSADYFWDWASTVIRLESSFTNKIRVPFSGLATMWEAPPGHKDHVPATQVGNLRSRKIQWAVGLDRPTWIPWINRNKTTFLSFQALATHILNWKGGAHWGTASPRLELIFTAVAQTNYYRDRITPQAWVAYLPTPKVNGWTGGFNVEWLITDHWSVKGGVILIAGGRNRHKNLQPFWPIILGPSALPSLYNGNMPDLAEMASSPAFGIVKENFAAARDRDEFFFKFQYRF